MKLTVTIDLTKLEEAQLGQNSIERVLNNAIFVGGEVDEAGEVTVPEDMAERASILWQDCEELKPLVCKIWAALQNARFEQLVAADKAEGKSS